MYRVHLQEDGRMTIDENEYLLSGPDESDSESESGSDDEDSESGSGDEDSESGSDSDSDE
jgi:hypothetical protein